MTSRPLYTVGHSTHPVATLIELLRRHGVARLLDVRSAPWSRRHPQFNREPLGQSLGVASIEYAHEPELGGLREARSDSVHLALPGAGFRGYADHMDTPGFQRVLESLIQDSQRRLTAVMCAEADPGHCHRGLLADALTARRVAVLHILPDGSTRPHALRPEARIHAGRVSYPGPPDLFDSAREEDEDAPTR
jgi:uncharacterized protein (DUF488 family)